MLVIKFIKPLLELELYLGRVLAKPGDGSTFTWHWIRLYQFG